MKTYFFRVYCVCCQFKPKRVPECARRVEAAVAGAIPEHDEGRARRPLCDDGDGQGRAVRVALAVVGRQQRAVRHAAARREMNINSIVDASCGLLVFVQPSLSFDIENGRLLM